MNCKECSNLQRDSRIDWFVKKQISKCFLSLLYSLRGRYLPAVSALPDSAESYMDVRIRVKVIYR